MAQPVVPVRRRPAGTQLLPERACEHPTQAGEEVAAIETLWREEEEEEVPASETWSAWPLSFQALMQKREESVHRSGEVASKYSKKSGRFRGRPVGEKLFG